MIFIVEKAYLTHRLAVQTIPPTFWLHSVKYEFTNSASLKLEWLHSFEYCPLLSSHFRDPLEVAGANLSLLQDEIEDAVTYVRTYLGIESTDYQKVKYNLYVCPNAAE